MDSGFGRRHEKAEISSLTADQEAACTRSHVSEKSCAPGALVSTCRGLRDAQAGAVQTPLARAAFPGCEARWAVPDSAVRSAGSILLDLNLLQKAVNKKAVGFLQK